MKSRAISLVLLVVAAGCAGVENGGATGAAGRPGAPGAAGQGGAGAPAPGQLAGLVALAVAPATQTVTFLTGATAQAAFTAMGTFSDGSTRDVTSMITWSSSLPQVVMIASGLPTARGAGRVDVTATSGRVSGSARLMANVSGTLMNPTFPAADRAALDGAAAPGAADIRYPLDGALFPGNWGAVRVQVSRTSTSQTSARIAVTGMGVDIKYYGACEPGPGSATGCYVTLPSSFTSTLAASSEGGDLTLTARLAGGGAGVVEGRPVTVAWTSVSLTGGLYYWTTINGGATTAIHRYDFSGDTTKPQPVYTDTQVQAPAVDGVRCIGCHAIRHDGKKMAMTLGGSYPASFQMIDVATGDRLTYEALPVGEGYATQTTFNRDGSRMLQMFRGFPARTPTRTRPTAATSPSVSSAPS